MLKELMLSLDLLTVNHLADTIYRTEGSGHTKYPYGIKSVVTTNPRAICINTITHAWRDFEGECQDTRSNSKLTAFTGVKSEDSSKRTIVSLPFIQFLGYRYCPPSCDTKGYCNWTNNVWRIYEHD